MTIELFLFNHKDAPYEALAFIHGVNLYDAWDADTFDALLTIYGTKGIVLLEDGVAKGFILYRQAFDDAEILTFCVIPNDQNKGFGQKLIEEMFTHLQKPGKCFLEVSNTNEAAIHLYKKTNFKIVHTRKDYYGQGQDAFMMMKLL